MSEKFDYKRYLASREWALLREAIKKRSGGWCERCMGNDEDGPREMAATHHLTYERIGHERLEDLLATCGPCHEFLSGKTSGDPLDLDVNYAIAQIKDRLGLYAEQRGREHEGDARDLLEIALEHIAYVLTYVELAKQSLPVNGDVVVNRMIQVRIQNPGDVR